MKKNIVAIIGHPNVGKSTLFNKIAGGKIAIIEDIAGVTRDRLYQDVSWNNKNFTIIVTGGIEDEKENFQKEIRIQAEFAISEASIILFVVDGKLGLTKDDLIIRDILRRSGKKVIVAINKIDTKEANDNLYDFYELGFDNYIEISAEQNLGIADLLDEIVEGFRKNEKEDVTKVVFGTPLINSDF